METNDTTGKDKPEDEAKLSMSQNHYLTFDACALTDRYKLFDVEYQIETQRRFCASEVRKLFGQHSDHVKDLKRLLIQQKEVFNRQLTESRPLTEIQTLCHEIWNDEIKNIPDKLRQIGMIVEGVRIFKYDPVCYYGVECCDGKCDNEINKRPGINQN
ncbi:MAG: hypothetical protein Q9183_004429 [Haloplaca sp. 2 TL-2023]